MSSSTASDHERISAILSSLGHSFHARASEHEQAAEKARNEKHRVMSMQHGIPDEARARLEGTHDAEIRKHERAALVNRRRGEHASRGVLLDSPDERNDSEYQRSNADVVAMAHRCGRARYTAEGLDD
jgi:hypothetical protein